MCPQILAWLNWCPRRASRCLSHLFDLYLIVCRNQKLNRLVELIWVERCRNLLHIHTKCTSLSRVPLLFIACSLPPPVTAFTIATTIQKEVVRWIHIQYRTLTMVRPPQIDQFWNHIIRKSVRSCLQELSTACHDCQLPSGRRRRKRNFHHFCRVKGFEWVASAQEDPIFRGEFETHTQLLNARSDFFCPTDATKPVGPIYLTRKGFDKILNYCSAFTIFRWVY